MVNFVYIMTVSYTHLDRLTETYFTCQDMIEDANYFGMDMEITRVGAVSYTHL